MNDESAVQHLARRQIWDQKYAIRACYRGWYERMQPFIVPGPSVEIGAGSGDFKSFWPGLMTSDLVASPLVDMAADALRLPLASGSLSNFVVIDLLHHLRDPHEYLKEAHRVLRPGGRILAIEPYITPFSYVGYRAFHHENIWFGGYQKSADKSDPWEGNLALPNVLFGRDLPKWPSLHPQLRIIHRQKFGLLDFQLACGFKPRPLIKSPRLYEWMLVLDRYLDGLAALWAFRIFCVIEKK
jgi:SAM-dependent methyltransferase